MTMTYREVLGAHDVEIPPHLEAQAEIPVLAGPQRQGDLIILPMPPGRVAGAVPIPPAGVAVVRGENGGNTHLLVGAGRWAPRDSTAGDCGTLIVEAGEVAFLIHPEHGANAMAPGSYVVRRQREQADELRLVAD